MSFNSSSVIFLLPSKMERQELESVLANIQQTFPPLCLLEDWKHKQMRSEIRQNWSNLQNILWSMAGKILKNLKKPEDKRDLKIWPIYPELSPSSPYSLALYLFALQAPHVPLQMAYRQKYLFLLNCRNHIWCRNSHDKEPENLHWPVDAKFMRNN